MPGPLLLQEEPAWPMTRSAEAPLDGDGRSIAQHAVVAGVGHIEVAVVGVQGQAERAGEAVGRRSAAMVGRARVQVGLADHAIRAASAD